MKSNIVKQTWDPEEIKKKSKQHDCPKCYIQGYHDGYEKLLLWLVAQRKEQMASNHKVAGSNPAKPTRRRIKKHKHDKTIRK